MAVLSDRDLRSELSREGGLRVSPLADNAVQPSSIDIRLGREFGKVRTVSWRPIEPWDATSYLLDGYEIEQQEVQSVGPGEFILGVTLEHVYVPDYLVARIEGRSSLARLGLIVHTTAGYVDPGWDGVLTLELVNLNSRAMQLRPGMDIAQLSVERLSSPAERPYGSQDLGSKYTGAGMEPSRYGKSLTTR